MTDGRITDELAIRVMHWRPAPGRYVKSGRAWIPRWRFQPLTNLDDAFQLLDQASNDYSLTAMQGGRFTAEVRLPGRVGRISGESKARTIALAVGQAIGLELPPETESADRLVRPSGQQFRGKRDGI